MLTECQKGLLQLLKEIDDICTRHNIDFYLAGGSLVGAIRHHGFLPWDDDADIHMTREGAEKFISLQEEFLPGRMVVSKATHPEFPAIHWRYMDTNQTTMLRSSYMTDSPQGQFVDIFILDPIPNDEEKQQEILKKYYVYSELVVNAFVMSSRRSEEFFEKYNELRAEQKKNGYEGVYRRLEKELFEYPEEGNDYYMIRSPLATCPIYPKKMWGKPRRVSFEDTTMPVACEAEQVLMMAYGDRWVDVPQIAERETHTLVSEPEFPYMAYELDYTRVINKQEVLDFSYRKKDKWFEIVADRNYANKRINKFGAYIELIKLEQKIKEYNINLKQLVLEGRYRAIRELFSGYYRVQFVRHKYYNNYFALPDDMLWTAMYPLAIHGEYNKVQKVFALKREEEGQELSEELLSLEEFCNKCTDVTNALYVYKDYKNAREIVDEFIVKFPDSLIMKRADIFLALQQMNTLRKAYLIKKRIEEYLQVYTDDGELLKYYADVLRYEGKTELAIKYYKKAYSLVVNGLVQTEISEILKMIDN